MVSFLNPLLHAAAGDLSLRNERTGLTIATTLLAAFDSKARRTGLLRHASLAAGTALIIAPTNAIHTFFMRFAIDVAFVAKDGRVVKVRTALPPWRVAAALGAHAVIELPPGTLGRSDTKPGDRLVIAPR